MENLVAWARKVRNHLNAHLRGLRSLMLQVETSTNAVTDEHIDELDIPTPDLVSSGIHSFLIGITEGAPNTIVDNALGNGFEAWRRLVREFDPQSSEHNFGRMQTVMRQPRVKNLKDFTARVESWEREVRTLVDRTKQPIPEWVLTHIMIEMLLVEHEAHLRNYMVKPDSTFSCSSSHRGPSPTDYWSTKQHGHKPTRARGGQP